MTDIVGVEIDTETEAYPVLSIRNSDRYWHGRPRPDWVRVFDIPAEMLTQLVEAQRAVHRAELQIMRYVATRPEHDDIREWLETYDDDSAST